MLIYVRKCSLDVKLYKYYLYFDISRNTLDNNKIEKYNRVQSNNIR